MSKFEKLIVPLVDDCISPIDLTSVCGFIDSYTVDKDNPSSEKEFYLVYDSDVNNKWTSDRARRFSMSRNLKRKYIKYVNNKPLLVYLFWVNPSLQKYYNGILAFNYEQKEKLLKFWGFGDDAMKAMLNNSVIHTTVEHSIPLEDYRESFSDYLNEGLIINKKEIVSNEATSFFCIYCVKNPIHRNNMVF